MKDVIKKLELEVEKTRKRLQEEEAALVVLKRMLKSSDSDSGQSSPRQVRSVLSKVPTPTFFSPPEPPLKVNDIIRNAIFSLPMVEFDVRAIENRVIECGDKIDASQPRSRISMVLKDLEDKGIINKVYEGRGGVPNRYRMGDQRKAIDYKLSEGFK